MKKVFALCLILFSAAGLMAQDNKTSPFRGGIKINPSLMWLKTDVDNPDLQKIENNGVRLGFSYGVFGDYYFAENYGFSAELRIAHLGGSYTWQPVAFIDSTVQRDLKLQYIEIPLSIKMRTNEIGYMRYYGQFGFVPAFNIKAKADITTSINGVPREQSGYNVSKDVNAFVTYLLIGAGVEYNLGGTTSLLGGISFHNGFLNVWNKSAKDNFTSKPAYVALNLGVIF